MAKTKDKIKDAKAKEKEAWDAMDKNSHRQKYNAIWGIKNPTVKEGIAAIREARKQREELAKKIGTNKK